MEEELLNMLEGPRMMERYYLGISSIALRECHVMKVNKTIN